MKRTTCAVCHLEWDECMCARGAERVHGRMLDELPAFPGTWEDMAAAFRAFRWPERGLEAEC